VGEAPKIANMPEYRYYLLDHRHYVVATRTVACETDDNARAVADGLLDDSSHLAIEVWAEYHQVYERKKGTPRVP